MARMMSASEISDAGLASQKPPSRAALAAHDVAAPQVRQDRLEELAWDVLRLGELLGRDMAIARRGELDGGAQRVVGACGQSHARHYAASRSEY